MFFVANIQGDIPSVLVVQGANYTSWFRYGDSPPAGADALYVEDSTVTIATVTDDQLTPVDPPIVIGQ